MYRIRYNDEGRSQALANALARLDYLASAGELRVVWCSAQRSPALLVATNDAQEPLLVEGLAQDLPGGVVHRESVDHLRSGLGRPSYVTHLPAGQPHLLAILAQLDRAMVRCDWRTGRLSPIEIRSSATPQALRAIVRATWAGARAGPLRWPVSQALLPSDLMQLPPAQQHLTLASRNTQEIVFAESPAGHRALLLGCDLDGRPVTLPRHSRTVWIGDAAPVNRVLSWITGCWAERLLVLDATDAPARHWQARGRSITVDWRAPGRSVRINPIARLPHDSLDTYVERVLRWLASLHITEAVIGSRMMRLLRAYVKLLSLEAELTPPMILSLLGYPDQMDEYGPRVSQLDEAEQQTWATRGRNDAALLKPGYNVLRGLFDRYTEMTLWMPPFIDPADLAQASTVVLRIPVQNGGQRKYWGGMLPLLTDLFQHPDTLILGLGVGSWGHEILKGSRSGGATTLLWGETTLAALGCERLPTGTTADVHLLAGAGVGGVTLAQAVGVSTQLLAAQAEDQAILRTPETLGSVRFRMPQVEMAAERVSGWMTVADVLPPVLSLAGDVDAALKLTSGLIGNAQAASGPLLVLCGNRELWGALGDLGVLTIPAAELPMLNPLTPAHLSRWLWWARGLNIATATIRAAHRGAVRDVQGLLAFAAASGDRAAVAVLKDVVQSAAFGWQETDPAMWFAESPLLAVESHHPAITRCLLMSAVEAQARVVLWQAGGVVEADYAALRGCRTVLYPEQSWTPDVLVGRTTNGALTLLPARLQQLAPTLPDNEACLYRRDCPTTFSRVVVYA
jgi:hypothetical protein